MAHTSATGPDDNIDDHVIEPVGDPQTQLTDAVLYAGEPELPSSDPEHAADRRWHVGTLSYTLGGLVVLFCWLLWGDFAWAMKDRSIALTAQSMLANFKPSAMFFAIVMGSIPPAFGLFLGPIVSYRSDRHRGRFGRRVPYMLVPTPIAALSIGGLAFTPWFGHLLYDVLGSHGVSLNACVLTVFCVFWTIFELSTTIANTIFGAFVNDVVPRPLLGRFYGLFRAFSLIAGMIYSYWLLGRAGTYYSPIFLGVALIYGLGVMAMCFAVKEGDYPAPPVSSEGQGSPFAAIGTYFRECFGDPYYRWVFITITVSNLGFLPVNLFNIPFANSIHVNMFVVGKLTTAYFFFSLCTSIPLGWLVDRFDPLRVSMVALILHASGAIFGGIYGGKVWAFEIAFLMTGAFSGTYFTATAAIGPVLLPRSKFAQYASALQMTTSVATMLVSPLLGEMLDLTHDEYRYTYAAGFAFDIAGLILTFILYRKFIALGGPRNYVAPEIEAVA